MVLSHSMPGRRRLCGAQGRRRRAGRLPRGAGGLLAASINRGAPVRGRGQRRSGMGGSRPVLTGPCQPSAPLTAPVSSFYTFLPRLLGLRCRSAHTHISLYFLLTKRKNRRIIRSAQGCATISYLIKSGGGNGPMKPRQPAFQQGANSGGQRKMRNFTF